MGPSVSPPDDPVYFTETNNIFCEEILPLVKNAKLELPLDSADPLIPYQFHFEDSGWGQQWESNFDYEEPQRAGTLESCKDNPARMWWYEQGDDQEVPTWQETHLPDGDVGSDIQESDQGEILKEVDSSSDTLGLMVEEDNVEEHL